MSADDIGAKLERANRLLEAGRLAESLRCLDELETQVIDADDRVEWLSLRAFTLVELGRGDEALDLLESWMEEYAESARLHGALGIVLMRCHDLEAARQELEIAVELDDEDDMLRANLAYIYEGLHDYKMAARLYEEALALGADLDWTLQRKAAALIATGETAEARSTLKRYLSLVPDDTAHWISLAILFSDDEDFDGALACFREAEMRDADSASLRLNWGVTLVRAGRLDEARQQLARLRKCADGAIRALLLDAFILEEQGAEDEALRCYTRALSRVRADDFDESSYTYEMAMDFFTRRKLRSRGDRVLKQAYDANACTVELCEAYRELTGCFSKKGYWFNIVLEADYRDGLEEIRERGEDQTTVPTRQQRGFQIVARDRDEAAMLALEFAQRMGETNLVVREFVREEEMDDIYTGVYEVERESLVFRSR